MDYKINCEKLYQSLLDKKKELLTLSKQTESERGVVRLDQPAVGRLSRMDAMRAQAMAIETENRRQIFIEKIDLALIRIKQKTYGLCASCDGHIEKKRLENDPAVTICFRRSSL